VQVICHCYAIEKRRVVEAIEEGCRSVEQVKNRLGVTGNCAACLPDVEALLDFYANFPGSGRQGFPGAAAPTQDPPV
jgi:NAD(P)H-nitrite reductase large subunit